MLSWLAIAPLLLKSIKLLAASPHERSLPILSLMTKLWGKAVLLIAVAKKYSPGSGRGLCKPPLILWTFDIKLYCLNLKRMKRNLALRRSSLRSDVIRLVREWVAFGSKFIRCSGFGGLYFRTKTSPGLKFMQNEALLIFMHRVPLPWWGVPSPQVLELPFSCCWVLPSASWLHLPHPDDIAGFYFRQTSIFWQPGNSQAIERVCPDTLFPPPPL